ncbi:glycerophosphodiester phosphodiesterase [Aeromicrobium sp. CTD01-1L150]|uniref:glycerophosphodiester phosphodiesterase n=1 Tax=Aeromicrobium sp. CTD01-1L150 TaxID=3341830 RepID=UPI0035BEC383
MKADLSRYRYFEHPTPLPIAHRGGAKLPGLEQLENTMAAFRAAVELGYTYLETDVHASRDGVVYAFHDLDLARLTGSSDAIATLESSQVDAVRLGDVEPIPRLTTLLQELPHARLNIDVKSDEAVEPTVRTLHECDALERVCLASFSGRRLRRIRELVPQVATSTGPAEVAAVRLGPTRRLRARAVRAGAQCLQVPVRHGPVTVVSRTFVSRAHDLGMQVHVWTVDDPHEMRSLLQMGVDGIVTDRPDVLKDVLIEAGDWRDA